MLKLGEAYVETGQKAYEKLFKERTLRNLYLEVMTHFGSSVP
jgi:hypothetical protein